MLQALCPQNPVSYVISPNFNFLNVARTALSNAVNGQWTLPASSKPIPCPMTGEDFIRVPDTQREEAQPFIDSLKSVPKSGLHNPYKHPERYDAARAFSICCTDK